MKQNKGPDQNRIGNGNSKFSRYVIDKRERRLDVRNAAGKGFDTYRTVAKGEEEREK